MTRSLWKGPFLDSGLIRTILRTDPKGKVPKIYSRRSVILPQFVGMEVEIYNGRSFQSVLITEKMIGHTFGEFALTRKPFVPKKK
uniref:Small ribosomal subunit protein uS19m n=1 Tax=Chloropicon maureeniae TaxID=1461542 RepID=A0A4D6C569_9CHLO|nr:ribosomal protein S19 [Chloropicon maureeniae]QBX98824.1 ribosomal protein S19 [Chloropicon maureeniae]